MGVQHYHLFPAPSNLLSFLCLAAPHHVLERLIEAKSAPGRHVAHGQSEDPQLQALPPSQGLPQVRFQTEHVLGQVDEVGHEAGERLHVGRQTSDNGSYHVLPVANASGVHGAEVRAAGKTVLGKETPLHCES